jgi:hypothetical protein
MLDKRTLFYDKVAALPIRMTHRSDVARDGHGNCSQIGSISALWLKTMRSQISTSPAAAITSSGFSNLRRIA